MASSFFPTGARPVHQHTDNALLSKLRQKQGMLLPWLALFFVSFLFYIFDSGGLQISNLILVVIVVFSLGIMTSLFPYYRTIAITFLVWIGYTVFANMFNFIIDSDTRLLLAPTYYFYNFLVFTLIFSLFMLDDNRFKKWVAVACLCAAAAEFTAILFTLNVSVRAEGTFNNPNQLGYWALATTMIYALCKLDKPLTVSDFLLLFLCCAAAAFSLSKAAMVSIAVALIIFLYQKISVKNFLRIFIILPLAGGAIYTIWEYILADAGTKLVDQSVNRINKIGQDSDDNAAGRNYDRIWRFPEYLAIGAGEGGYSRFTTGIRNNEIHSAFGMIIFSYGLVGSMFFLTLMHRILYRARTSALIYLVPWMLYSLTHQSLRSPLFWTFLAMIAADTALRRLRGDTASVNTV